MLDNNEIEGILSEAGERVFQGDLPGARLLLESALQKESDEPRIKSLLAHVYSRLDMHIEALHIYDQLLRIFPKEGSLYFRKGMELLYLGNVPEGISMMQKAVRISPNEREWQEFLKHVRAIHGFENPPSSEPDFPEDWMALLEKLRRMSHPKPEEDDESHVKVENHDQPVITLEVGLKRSVYVRQSHLIAGEGEIRFLASRAPFGQDLLRAMGEGTLHLSAGKGKMPVSIHLTNAKLFINGEYLLAFPADITWEEGSLRNSNSVLNLLSLKGSGSVYLSIDDSGFVELEVKGAKHLLIIPAHRLVAWHGRLLAQYRDDGFVYVSGVGHVLVVR